MTNIMRQENTLFSLKNRKRARLGVSHEKICTKNKKNSIKDTDQKTKEEEQNPKIKYIIEFDQSLAHSVKSLAVKKMKQ